MAASVVRYDCISSLDVSHPRTLAPITYRNMSLDSKLTSPERIHLAVSLGALLTKSVLSVLVALIYKGELPTRRTFLRIVAQNTFSTLSLRQVRALGTNTNTTITKFCTKNAVPRSTVTVPVVSPTSFASQRTIPPAILHFIHTGSSTSQIPVDNANEPVLLYFHGGGYVTPISTGHIVFTRRAARAASSSLVLLEYTVAPDLTYPGQLAQASAALQYLLEQRGGDASNIIIGGDSAGGNLTLALLAHLRDPAPGVTPVRLGTEGQQKKLRGALCISPRTISACTAPSWTLNAHKDILSPQHMELITSNWKPVRGEVWAEPLLGGRAFWSDVVAERVLLIAGGDEVYRDDIVAMAEVMGATTTDGGATNSKRLIVAEGEIHAQVIVDVTLGIENGQMLQGSLHWLEGI